MSFLTAGSMNCTQPRRINPLRNQGTTEISPVAPATTEGGMIDRGEARNTFRKLHLGCFNFPVGGWVNADITPHIRIARVPGLAWLVYKAGKMTHERYREHQKGIFDKIQYVDVTKRIPFANGEFDFAFSCHMLEHLYFEDALHCLREVYRVLKPGGICRTVIPDLDRIISEYDPANPEPVLKRIFSTDERVKNEHHWLYNEQNLSRLLKQVGFKQVYRCAYRQGRCPDLELLDNRPDESLFMEAEK
jgi:predicted SAM-dependent methyltransferase